MRRVFVLAALLMVGTFSLAVAALQGPPPGPTPSRLETPSWSKSLLPEPQSYDWVGQRRR